MLNSFDQSQADALAAALRALPLKPAEPRYLEEPRGKFQGLAGYVAAPRTPQMLADLVRFANAQRIALLPYGGGTGLVGGQIVTSEPHPLIVSMENMTAIRAVHAAERTLIAEAGVTIETLQNAAEDVGLLFPLSYASKGTAQIGAGLSVNSGGLNVLRYGMARDQCLGIEAVLPDGQIFNGLKRLRKDNTGYDLRNLMIGAEGTLGFITAATLKLAARPVNVATAYLAVKDPSAALALLGQLSDRAGDVVSSFELMAANGYRFLAETYPDTRLPFDDPPEWSVLVEIGTGASTDAVAVLEALFADGFEAGLITDGLIASSGQQRDAFWAVREMLPEANKAIGSIASHDISLPLSEIPDFMEEARVAIEAIGAFRINAFGHLGDGNLHYNVFPPKGRAAQEFANLAPEITRVVHDMTMARDGSFSAEHGVGRLKTAELAAYGDPTKLAVMRTIKDALDPNGIMNPGAVFPT